MSNEIEFKFKCKIKTCRFESEGFRIYVVDVDKKSCPNLQSNYGGEYVLVGDISKLLPNTVYNVIAEKDFNKKFGIQYKCKNIRAEKPTDLKSSKKFLYEIITQKQADTLLEVYPNIIDMVIKGETDKVDLNKTKGIKEKTFSHICKAITENFVLMDIVELFSGTLTLSNVKKIYKKYTSVEKILEELSKEPYECLCELSGVGFKTADAILLDLEANNKELHFTENLLKSSQRLKACMNYILSQNESCGNTKMEVTKLRKECSSLTPECIDKFVQVLKENDDDFTVFKEDKTISRTITFLTEFFIASSIKALLTNSVDWHIDSEKYRVDKDISLTDEQLGVIKNLSKYNISLLTAPAGSGKSQSIKNVINMLEDNKKSYLLCTPTGKSAEVLGEYCNRECGTIHRQYKYNPSNGENPWGYNSENKAPIDVIIVDESGMVDIFLMKRLLEGIDTSKTKILLVFDSYQLASVGCGNIVQDLLSSGIIPTTFLTKIFRYDEGGLMQIATKIRNSEQFLSSSFTGIKSFGTLKDFVFKETIQESIPNDVVKLYTKLIGDGYTLQEIMVLTSQNKGDYGTKAINKAIQERIQYGKNNKFIQRGFDKFYEGDKVIQIKNNYRAINSDNEEDQIYNGNTGIIEKVNFDNIIVNFGNKSIIYDKECLGQLELGYCMTIHKSQGDSAKQVIVISPKAHTFMLNSNLLYVGVTRAKKRAFIFGNISTINRAIKKKENLQRETNLNLFLNKIKLNSTQKA